MRSRNSSRRLSRSSLDSSFQRRISMPWAFSAGETCSLKQAACRAVSRPARSSVRFSTWPGSWTLNPSTGRPAAIRRIRPATRTMKNSSRLLAKMARKRTRSSSGTASSSASSRTRWLNRSQLSSRSRYRSGGSGPRPACSASCSTAFRPFAVSWSGSGSPGSADRCAGPGTPLRCAGAMPSGASRFAVTRGMASWISPSVAAARISVSGSVSISPCGVASPSLMLPIVTGRSGTENPPPGVTLRIRSVTSFTQGNGAGSGNSHGTPTTLASRIAYHVRVLPAEEGSADREEASATAAPPPPPLPDDLLLPRPGAGSVAVAPPGEGPGYWAGGPSAVAADGEIFLSYRLRRPLGDGRGHAGEGAPATDGVHFEPVTVIGKEEMDTDSLERPFMVRTPAGTWRLYLSCATPGTKHWRVEVLEAAHPAEFRARSRQLVLPGDSKKGVKDPVIVRRDDGWHMWVTCHPLADPAETDQMVTEYATSADGLDWA